MRLAIRVTHLASLRLHSAQAGRHAPPQRTNSFTCLPHQRTNISTPACIAAPPASISSRLALWRAACEAEAHRQEDRSCPALNSSSLAG